MNPGATTASADGVRRAGDDCWNRIGVAGDRSCPELIAHVHCRNCPVYSAAGVTFLDRDIPAGYVDEWTAHVARPRQTAAPDTQSLLLFRLGAEWLGLPTRVFREVATQRPVHSLPHRRSAMLLGIVNIRGELLVCVSLTTALGIEPSAKSPAGAKVSAYPRLLVAGIGAARFAFPVDEVHGILRHAPGDLRPLPGTVARAVAVHARAVLPWQAHSVGCLDEQLVFASLEKALA